jgi:lysophospholipase L1-like esterase
MRWMAGVMAAGMAMSMTAGAQTSVPLPPAAQVPNPAAAPTPPAAQVAAGSEAKMEADNAKMKAQLQDWAQLGRYRAADQALPAEAAGRVVFYGDSITDAWTLNGGSFFPGKPYVNRGISGQTTPQMLVRFRQDVVALHPETVVILAGTNDIAGNTGPSTMEMIEDNFKGMVEIARANGIRVILASVTPAAQYPWRPEVAGVPQSIEALNAWLKDYCVQEKLTYLDYWTAMAGPDGGMKPGISKDGVHPNGAGYAIMQPMAEAAIAATAK